MGIKIEKVWEDGKKAKFHVYGTTDREMVFQYGITSVFISDDETFLEVNTSSKSDARAMVRLQEDLAVAQEQAETKVAPKESGARRPELVEVAEREGLNRGKGWFASDYDVDRLSLDPSWVGRPICYVYE